MKNKIILFSGKAGTGKSTCAKYLLELIQKDGLFGGGIFSLAEGVKEAASNSFGWDGEKDARGRQLLQNIGKVGRLYNVDIWVRETCEKILEKCYWNASLVKPYISIIDDWRFENEYYYLREYADLITVHLEDSAHEILKNTPAYEDESENGLNHFTQFNYVITDAKNVAELQHAVQKIYNDLKKEI